MEASKEFVYKKFAEYYRAPSTVVSAPLHPEQREFGYLMFKERFMVRHRSFSSVSNLRVALAETVPSDVYYSCAYYENPDFDMDKKGWLGADLVFDIDADHIPTKCDKKHDEWTCVDCGRKGRGTPPEICPNCKRTKFESKTWPCDLCIESARAEACKLIDILQKDFGFSDDELRVFFSGHRGYHVHIENEAVRKLDSMARKEIVDYVICLGLNLFEKKSRFVSAKADEKFRLHDFGWNKRLKDAIKNLINSSNAEDLQKIVGSQAKLLSQSKGTALTRCLDEGMWGAISGISDRTWMKLAWHAKNQQTAQIDTVVTTDIHRLIRMNGTLHGKTGLKKIEFPTKGLQVFDPFTEAVAFRKGAVKVRVSDAPEFRLGGQTLGPFKNQTVELPVSAAIMLICKRRAEVAD
jgi:DNA primase small subunit